MKTYSCGQVRSGVAEVVFAEGYTAALAEASAGEGVWCGAGHVAPHEITAQVFDHLDEKIGWDRFLDNPSCVNTCTIRGIPAAAISTWLRVVSPA